MATAGEQGVSLGALAVQFSLRQPRLAGTLVGPRDSAEVEANLHHTATPLPADVWADRAAQLESMIEWVETHGGINA